MNAPAFDRYQAGESSIHRLDPRVKVIVTLLFILSTVTLPDGAWLAFALSWGLTLLAGAQTGLGPGYTLKRSFVALPFALAALTTIFSLPGQPLLMLSFGRWELVATDTGLLRFVSIVIRSWIAVQGAILLTATTAFPDLMHALRHLRVPPLIVAIISLMYRYLYVLADETGRLLRAREARSARLGTGGGSMSWRARVAGHMAGQLFLRSYERSDRVYQAMLARGYTGDMQTLNPHIIHQSDWIFAAISIALLGVIQLLARIHIGV